MESKIQNKLDFHGFGFPITLRNVPMIKVQGKWAPDINLDALADQVLEDVAQKKGRLTGLEIRFIRLSLEMTIDEFAKRFVVTRHAVMKWEKAGADETGMQWATEKDIRLEAIHSRIESGANKCREFVEVFGALSKGPVPTRRPRRLRPVDIADLAGIH